MYRKLETRSRSGSLRYRNRENTEESEVDYK